MAPPPQDIPASVLCSFGWCIYLFVCLFIYFACFWFVIFCVCLFYVFFWGGGGGVGRVVITETIKVEYCVGHVCHSSSILYKYHQELRIKVELFLTTSFQYRKPVLFFQVTSHNFPVYLFRNMQMKHATRELYKQLCILIHRLLCAVAKQNVHLNTIWENQ